MATTVSKAESASRPMTEEADFLQIKSIDHVHFYVGNAKHALYYWWKAFGFKPVAYSGLETGNRAFASYVLESGQARFVISAAYSPTHEIAAHHLVHGDGVKVIALEVDDVEKAWQATTERGGKSAWAPREEKDDNGIYRTSAIYTYGETLHVFVDRADYKGVFAPTYKPISYEAESTGLAAIDHMVGNVPLGKMNHWVNFYHQVMGFRQLLHFDDKDISTEYSALMSKVMQNGNGRVKFRSTSPPKDAARVRSRSISIIISRPACSTLPLSRATFSKRLKNFANAVLSSCACPIPITRCFRIVSERSRRTCKRSMIWASWLTAMMKAISCRFSPARFRIVPRCSSRSSSAMAHRDSAKATSEPCSNRLSWNRNEEGIYKRHLSLRTRAKRAVKQSPVKRRTLIDVILYLEEEIASSLRSSQ